MKHRCNYKTIDLELSKHKSELPGVVKDIVNSYEHEDSIKHLGSEQLPSKEEIIQIITKIEKVLFPGFYGDQNLDKKIIEFHTGDLINDIYEMLSGQIKKSIIHECSVKKEQQSVCVHCVDEANIRAMKFLKRIPDIRKILASDVKAAYQGDPAAKSYYEVVFSYPCIKAITIYRIAHELWNLNVPLIPRIMTEYAHSNTGVDIHPGAHIGQGFFIDHGTGVVIGETTIIGNNVKLYQNVTLGALSVKKEMADFNKRHPTIGDNVTIYSGATILGGDVEIGEGSIIGGNVWLTTSIPSYTKVFASLKELNKINIKDV